MHHVEKRLPPCEQNVSTKFFTSALPLFFGVSAFRHLLDMIHRQESKESMILLGALKILKITKKSIYIYTVHQYTVTHDSHISIHITSLHSVLTSFRKVSSNRDPIRKHDVIHILLVHPPGESCGFLATVLLLYHGYCHRSTLKN